VIILPTSFSKSYVFKTFFVHIKTQSRRFQISAFEARSRKALFSLRISVNGRPRRRNKAAFSNFPGLARTGP